MHATIIEDGYGAVRLATGVVLPGPPGAWIHLEGALLAAQPPQDLTALAVDLVDGGGSAGGDKQVGVVIDIYGVDVEVVEGHPGILRWVSVGLFRCYVLQAVPLEDDFPTLDVYLLSYSIQHPTVLRATDRGEVHACRAVDRDQGGFLRGDEKLVMVSLIAVARPNPLYLPIGAIQDHVLALAMSGHDFALTPREHRLAPIALHLEVHRDPVLLLQGMEPHRLSAAVENHGAVLPGSLLRS